MTMRHLGFVLLVWFPRVLRAQTAAQPCPAPTLGGGFFLPVREAYSHETQITYACDDGSKPAVEGWWATCSCQNGTWSHVPQCIDERACIPPTIPNAKFPENPDGWYENGDTMRISCDQANEHKDHVATAKCEEGIWSSLPICEKIRNACSEPPRVPHAVITGVGYQEVFAADSEVQYECEEGYATEEARTKKSVFCLSGNWTEAPVCSRRTEPGTGHAGSTVEETSGGNTAGDGGTGGRYSTSSGSGTPPVGRGSSTSSGSTEREIQITPISTCRNPPRIQNGDFVKTGAMFLKYQCNSFYNRVGPETVVCYPDGTWSEVPTCKAAYCSVDTQMYPELQPSGVKFIKDGEKKRLPCVQLDEWWTDHYSVFQCTNGRGRLSRCCSWITINMNRC
ncbi:complement factor H isoform X1 [Scophthalmus maximus]|uniref:complement factor H isoform X1 n=1 Tax=Scophthalmus maximus TaxID=52904 RepID=UPI001FA8B919|nr:complement factor H isoform X1 [Scophthalmus maximus]